VDSTLEAELACVTTECECECEECESEEVAALRMSFCSDMGTFACPAPFALAGLGVKSPSRRSRSLEGVIVIVPVTGPVVPALFSSWRDMTRSSRAKQVQSNAGVQNSNEQLTRSLTHSLLTHSCKSPE
jgi:hypothetical protein